MAIPNLKTKLKQSMKKEIEREKEGGKGNDPRFLNYFDLKFDEKMTVLFVPDVHGTFWRKFKKHGPNLRIMGADKKERGIRVPHVNCAYHSSNEDCPVCQKGFELFSLAKETGDKSYKEEGKRWMARDYTLVSCIVLESPMEITATEDGNQVKLLYLPYGIENVIKEAINEDLVAEEDLCSTPFVIKKTKNQGGKASYDNSYFQRKVIDDDALAYLEDMVVEQFDYDELDVVPENTTTEDMEKWLAEAEAAYEKALNAKSRAGNGDEDDKEPPKQTSRLANIGKRKPVETEADDSDGDEEDDTPPFDNNEQESGEGEEEQNASEGRSALMGRLSKLRRN